MCYNKSLDPWDNKDRAVCRIEALGDYESYRKSSAKMFTATERDVP